MACLATSNAQFGTVFLSKQNKKQKGQCKKYKTSAGMHLPSFFRLTSRFLDDFLGECIFFLALNEYPSCLYNIFSLSYVDVYVSLKEETCIKK